MTSEKGTPKEQSEENIDLLRQLAGLQAGSEEWGRIREILQSKGLSPEDIDENLAVVRGERKEQPREDNEFLLKRIAVLQPDSKEAQWIEETLRGRGLGAEVDVIKKKNLPPDVFRG